MTTEQAAEMIALLDRTALATEKAVEWLWRISFVAESTMWAAGLAAGALWAIIFIRALYAKNIWT